MNSEANAPPQALLMDGYFPLFSVESILLFIVLIVLPAYAIWRTKSNTNIPLKGLALPKGSVRSMLALTVVGSFVVFLVFGGTIPSIGDRFTEIVAALTGVAGTIIGFYFGSGGSGNSSEETNRENAEPVNRESVNPQAASK